MNLVIVLHLLFRDGVLIVSFHSFKDQGARRTWESNKVPCHKGVARV